MSDTTQNEWTTPESRRSQHTYWCESEQGSECSCGERGRYPYLTDPPETTADGTPIHRYATCDAWVDRPWANHKRTPCGNGGVTTIEVGSGSWSTGGYPTELHLCGVHLNGTIEACVHIARYERPGRLREQYQLMTEIDYAEIETTVNELRDQVDDLIEENCTLKGQLWSVKYDLAALLASQDDELITTMEET